MYIRSISPIVASILIIVITVAIAGLFYAFTSGIFGSLTSSSNNLVNQQSQIVSFTINNVYCSNNIIYFNIYNKGNIPININNSQIIFTDNYGNTISINGSNIICNNGNIIPIGSNSLCYIINNYFCYYSYIDYIKSTNFIYNGINYNYEILNNKFNIIYLPNSSSYQVTLYNTQSISTPSPFQQDIAICNGSINIGNNFAYVNNLTLFNQINPNGQNVLFFNPNSNQLLYYSWYEGQLNYNGVTCDVWWVNIPQGIPANSNVTIYMYVGNSSANYYSQYYPYVGASPQVISGYDNGQAVFIAYGYFNNTFDGWSGYIFTGSYSPTATSYGIEMLNNNGDEGTYILPPNNGNIPKIPLIVEEAWYYTGGADANIIALFGNTNQQFSAGTIGSTGGGYTPASNLSTFVQFQYWSGASPPYSQAVMLKSAVTNQYLNYTSFPTSGGTVYSYLIVNSSYAQTGYYIYNSNQVWAPLTLLDTYPLSYNSNYGNYTYANLNYNPFQYPTLEIGAGTGWASSYQYVEWVVARAYPPNGVMPSIYIIAYAVI
jgi:flagellin-like protein